MPPLHFAGQLQFDRADVLATRGKHHLAYLEGLQRRLAEETPDEVMITHRAAFINGVAGDARLKQDVFTVALADRPGVSTFRVAGNGYFTYSETPVLRKDTAVARKSPAIKKELNVTADRLIMAAQAYAAGAAAGTSA